jgi:hypothetical protein
MTLVKMKSRSTTQLSQPQLNALADRLLLDLDNILAHFGVKYKKSSKKYYGGCPIHNGDPVKSPWNLFVEGDYYRGNWKCRSHNCHVIFQKSLLGFIRGLISRFKHEWKEEGDKIATFQETIDWGLAWTKQDFSSINIASEDIDKNKFISQTRINLVDQDKPKHYLSRDFVRKSLIIPASPFINRGFSAETLDKYDIGLTKSKDPSKEMFERIVIPIYDNDGLFLVGCTGRSIHKECPHCKMYHADHDKCPNEEEYFKFVKWRHSKTLKAERNLFNYWKAKKFIQECGTAVLVESVCNSLRLEENGIPISVGTFGAHFTEFQQLLINEAGALNLVVIPDQDEAGRTAAKMIADQYNRLFNIKIIDIPKNDVDELTADEVEQYIKPTLRKLGAIK